MTKLYVLTKTIFFPGTFLKGFWEHVVCRFLGIEIYAADTYLSRNRLCGHVSMLPAVSAGKSFFACFLPGLLNFFLGFPAFVTGVLTLGFMGVDVIDPLTGKFCPLFILYVLLYLFGASCMCSLFPYYEDALHLWRIHYDKDGTASAAGKVLAFLPTCVMTVGAFLERFSVPFFICIALLIYWILT